MRGGGDSTHSVPCRFVSASPGVHSRKHACWMSGSPEARVAPEASGIGVSSRSRLNRSTRSRPIRCQAHRGSHRARQLRHVRRAGAQHRRASR